MTYFSMIISFLILLGLVIVGLQNAIPMQIKVGWWIFQMSLPALVFWAALSGATMVAVLSLPKLAGQVLQTRRLHKEVRRLEGLCKEPRGEETV